MIISRPEDAPALVPTVARERIFDAQQFVEGARRAIRGVLRVSMGSSSSSTCTGWLITSRLVVVPGYALPAAGDAAQPARVQRVQGSRVLWEESVGETPELLGVGLLATAPHAFALLRLRTPRAPTLSLFLGQAAVGQGVSIVHFPGGRPALSLSVGRLADVAGSFLSYDADTLPGSGGAPVFDPLWRVIGVHMMADAQQGVNRGVTSPALVDALRKSASWPEIARSHQIVDVAAGTSELEAIVLSDARPIDDLLVKAALRSRINRKRLSSADAERLRPYVADPGAPQWVLDAESRRRALASVGSLALLRSRLPRAVAAGDVAQRVIHRIVTEEPPYDLRDAGEEELAWWIQAVRWFGGVAPSLPTPAEIVRLLERRRVRGRLEAVAGPGFLGRGAELKKLRDWFRREPPVPLSLTGIGGIGKSALIARFALELPATTPLFWLDFDRADLAPDDAVSVLSALVHQAGVQLDGFQSPPIDESSWPASAQAFARALAGRLARTPAPPLLVLDSFEVAQFAERYQELWPVLEAIAGKIPALRVVVTGRAPVPGLRLRERPAATMHLKGLAAADARAWLRSKGITQPSVLEKVLKLAAGVPLVLRLALHYVERGGRVRDLPKKLPAQIVAGFLYERILDRVQNPSLRPLATAVLVLRRLTADMIQPLFGDGIVELPPGDPAAAFGDLAREMALVEGTEVLRLRPEVRSATLKLLERDKGALVREVDVRAERWYAKPTADDPEMAAELVYHRLRLGRIAAAAEAWRDGCGVFLQYAGDDLKPQARAWLKARLGEGSILQQPLADWEQEAAERIRSARARGLQRAVAKILEERSERSPGSPLVFHEAFERRIAGDRDGALALLQGAPRSSGTADAERSVLRALLLAEGGRRHDADAVLSEVDTEAAWGDRQHGALHALAVRAARVKLATDLEAELGLLSLSRSSRAPAGSAVLSPLDAVLPALQQPGSGERIETSSRWSVPEEPEELAAFAGSLEARRRETLPGEPPELRQARQRFRDAKARPRLETGLVSPLSSPDAPLLQRVLEAGWWRWSLVTEDPFLARASRAVLRYSGDPLVASVLGSLALFAGDFAGLSLRTREASLFDVVVKAGSQLVVPLAGSRWDVFQEVCRMGLGYWPEPRSSDQEGFPASHLLFAPVLGAHARAVGLHLLCPDPLEQLVHRLAGNVAWIP